MKNRIAFYMEKLNRTPVQVAEELEVYCSTVTRWRDNEIMPTRKNMDKLAKLFGCTPKDLIE